MVWDLETLSWMNAPTHGPARIYDLGNGKFALGYRNERAIKVVRRITNKVDRLGRGLPVYKGVQARKPIIGDAAKSVTRDAAGRLLRKALGV